MTSGSPLRYQDRIKESRRVPVEALLPNPRNWRNHSRAQAEALPGLLSETGYVVDSAENEVGIKLSSAPF